MKFGKLLEEYQLPEWKAHYLKYNPLKKCLYEIKNGLDAQSQEKHTPSSLIANACAMTRAKSAPSFVPMDAPFSDIQAALQELPHTRDPVQAWKLITEEEIIRIGTFIDTNLANLTKQFEHLSAIANDAQHSHSPMAPGHFPELRMLQALNRVSEAVARLRGFAELNHAAVYKLMKKYDKVLVRKENDGLKLEYPRMVTETGLTNLTRFETLHAEIKREFELTSRYQGLEGSAEVARLCAGLGNPGGTVGLPQQGRFERLLFFFLGSSSALFLSILVLITLPPSHPSSYSNAYFMSSFCVFQVVFSIMLCIWGMGAVARTCDVNFINHMFLLDIDPRCRVGPHWLFSRAAGLTSLWILTFGMYVVDYKWNIFLKEANTVGYNDRASWHYVSYPIAALAVTVGFLLAPSQICPCRYRMALAHSVQRTACAPFYPVTFGDNLVGDVITSLAKPLQDIPASLCYLLSHHPQYRRTVDKFVAHGDTCPDWEHHIIVPLLSGLPFWFRLLQCARRFYDTGDRRNLANLGKYAASLLVVLVSHGGPFQASTPVLVAVSATATIYAAVWDVCLDWGLGCQELAVLARLGLAEVKVSSEQAEQSEREGVQSTGTLARSSTGSPLVKESSEQAEQAEREEVQVHRHFGPLFYWLAVVFDVIARCTWVLTLMPLKNITDDIIQRTVLRTFISSTEILRRSLWAVLRIEQEQVANASGYRARVWVPMFTTFFARDQGANCSPERLELVGRTIGRAM
eukprot:CAMPEP_0195155118 /NCGR_PEP_ID=MMETSP0448-20130528/183998_1 /TAXON_ID=66468 /ORGANISM="Heterocapsa triquestra, Strain CCMP 448" /LENGTH=744 /DNA_ID=CAMNT_0040193901 /DNA_START=138 /DNA_END=2370 /DNA_ORIENTATION=+